MCEPTYFDVLETDPVNLHMDPNRRPDREKAVAQHCRLQALYEALGVKVHLIPPRSGLVDMTFTANLGLVLGKRVLLSNFRPERRRDESRAHQEFLTRLGYEVTVLPQGIFFEGAGDAIPFRDKILCGYGFRTSKEALPYVERFVQREIVPLELVKPGKGKKICYHLDTAGIFLEEAGALLVYLDAFSKDAQKRLNLLGAVFPVSYENAAGLALNALVIPRKELAPDFVKTLKVSKKFRDALGVVITSDEASMLLERKIQQLGYIPVLTPLGEFLKAGGGAFCMTKII